jgi:hypothetical protein
LIPSLKELDERGYRYYFQYTLLANPRLMDGNNPSLQTSLDTFRKLADQIGEQRTIWRYDPIVFSNVTDETFHEIAYSHIADKLHGYTQRSVISIMDPYHKAQRRLTRLKADGIKIIEDGETLQERLAVLIPSLAYIAAEHGMEIVSCAEEIDLRPYGVYPGKCVDDDLFRCVFGLEVSVVKDPSQREACGCVVSRDIGMYDTCQYRCAYCYATNFERATHNKTDHDPDGEALLVTR